MLSRTDGLIRLLDDSLIPEVALPRVAGRVVGMLPSEEVMLLKDSSRT